MSGGAMVAISAGAAASRRRRMLQEQEEVEMTPYTREDLDDDWEFKIVRSGTGAFRKRERLERLIEEEARAGWVMLEKLDDYRIRFKRPRRARAQDDYLPPDVDPYRAYYGGSSSRTAVIMLVVVGLILFILALAGLLVFMMAARS